MLTFIKGIKKFSDVGALLLKLDMDHYKAGVTKLKSIATEHAMEEAHKLCVVLLVPCDSLANYLNEALYSAEPNLVLGKGTFP